ncbi:hypothetical protein MRP92_00740 [Flavobacterium covae]|uniref:hypothetical protein n=1 Tax=Flavobacterium covae TaxID=2906076 RepID=UPI001FB76FF9|nr:hypothetical protein [Flavobacterium covae]MCJ1805442.1 hypothetical protein [Flavobacterium covae]
MPNSKKHKILSVLNTFYEDKAQEALNHTDLGKSMSIEQLHSKTNFSISDLKVICLSLKNSNLVCPIIYTNEPNVLRYYINDLGRIALNEKYFLNLLWYKDYRIVIPALVSSVISIIGILISMSPSKDDKLLQERVDKLEQKLYSIQSKHLKDSVFDVSKKINKAQ